MSHIKTLSTICHNITNKQKKSLRSAHTVYLCISAGSRDKTAIIPLKNIY